MICLKKVTKSYGSVTVLKDVSFLIEPGEFVCITGPSGAGKSTLIHLLTGAEAVTKGSVSIDGIDMREIPPQVLQIFRQRVGIVFQDYKLLPDRTVSENIAFPLEVVGVPTIAIEKRVKEVLKNMELTKVKSKLPRELSGGEQARTAIARAIAHKPMILLADEPTGNIDPGQSTEVMNLFKDIHKEGTTVIIATHDSGLVDALQTRVIRFEDGELVRDSVGGYDHRKKKRGKDAPHKKHQIFKGAHLDLMTEEKDDTEEKEADKETGKGKKVKITSIN